MAFPGIFNINYYNGDTYEFNVFPKDSSGNVFDLTSFSGATLSISEGRGEQPVATAYSVISDDRTHIKCAIRPQDSLLLDATKAYVYDVQVLRSAALGEPYDLVYTLLTGALSVTEQVTPPTPVSIPGPPTNLSLDQGPGVSIVATWSAPTSGDAPTAYNIYGKVDALSITYALVQTIPASLTQFAASDILGIPLEPEIEYGVKITSVNSAGENTTDFAEGTITLVEDTES
jgi:hypothetical protein